MTMSPDYASPHTSYEHARRNQHPHHNTYTVPYAHII